MIPELTTSQGLAAVALGQGKTQVEAAAVAGVAVLTVKRWGKQDVFSAAVAAEAERIQAAVRAEGIANRQNRIDSQNWRHSLMRQVIEARADANRRRKEALDTVGGFFPRTTTPSGEIDFEGYAAAGAETGLMVHTVTYLKDGRREEWAVDTGLLKELREHEKQTAQEVGQWTEKREVTGKGGAPLVPEAQALDFDSYARAVAAVLAPARLGSPSADGDTESLDSAEPDR